MVPTPPKTVAETVGVASPRALPLAAGLMLDTVTRGRRETKMLAYLAIPGP